MENSDIDAKRILLVSVLTIIFILAVLLVPMPPDEVPEVELNTATSTQQVVNVAEAHENNPEKSVWALVTGYNTVPAQTDATPCIAASGDNICGRSDVVACPRAYPLGTEVRIDGKRYVCLDRTALKFDGRWDISCDKDMQCPMEVHGHKEVHIIGI